MSQLNQFRSFNVEVGDIDELIALSAFGNQLREEYKRLNLEEPEWLNDQLKAVTREVHKRTEDAREARVREIDARIDALATPEEKREKLRKERERLVGSAAKA